MKWLPNLDWTECLILSVFVCLVVLIIIGARTELSRDLECHQRGGIFIESTCFDKESVIVLTKK